MQYGYFDEERREYVITNPDTPAPWANYLGSPEYGAIITQKAVAVASWDTAATLSERLMRDAEQPALIEAVKLFCSGRLKIEGDSVTIRPEGRA